MKIRLLIFKSFFVIFCAVAMQQDDQTQKDKQDIILITDQEEISDNNSIVIPYNLVHHSGLLKEIVADCNNKEEPIPFYHYDKKTVAEFLPMWKLLAENNLVGLEQNLQKLLPQQVVNMLNIADYLDIAEISNCCKKVLVTQLSSAAQLAQFVADENYLKKNLNFNDHLAARVIAQKLLLLCKPTYNNVIKGSAVKDNNSISQKLLAQAVSCIGFNPDDTLLAAATENVVKLYDVKQSWQEQCILKQEDFPFSQLAFNCNDTVATAGTQYNSRVALWDYRRNNQKPYATLVDYEHNKNMLPQQVNALIYNNDGTMLATSCENYVTLWDYRNNDKPYGHIMFPNHYRLPIAFDPIGNLLATPYKEDMHKIGLFEYHKNIITPTITFPDVPDTGFLFTALTFNSDNILAAGTTGGHMKLWDYNNKKLLYTLNQPKSIISCLQFNSLNTLLAEGDESGCVTLHDYKNKTKLHQYYHNYQYPTVTSVVFTRDSALFASSSRNATIKIFNMISQKDMEQATLEKSLTLLAKEKLHNQNT